MRVRLMLMIIVANCLAPLIWYNHAQAKLECSNMVMCISTQRSGSTTHFTAINKLPHMPVTFAIQLKLKNLKVVGDSDEIFVLKGGEARQVFSLKPKRRDRSWRYSFDYKWVYGDLDAVHDPDQMYQLPFAAGERFKISQGCNGEFSHQGDEKYALDFNLPENTPVHAARAGTVAAVKQDSNRGGPSRRFKQDANYVFIRHDDGTIGFYFRNYSATLFLLPLGATI
ncbi:MAG: peptidoglycan DD-metalloendopeptidase family protein [Rhizobiaceae bacterium]|nr:peptidoglycan DD-metalloendopeptidase family protein [Rhizobiaceae bacterium]